ncbi:cytochrome C biogenesis protein CcmA [Sphingomonas sp. Leaf17]|uniref:heme ABC exporter ATP-binding protein CcmA n=1 Tax=Sphingomonas sp. Leaf17 TaxID=1735683 RepID=UPI0006FD44F6|nr:heme ABC exporter ATP-binding protein CcmA [Sphingomonas sp. Leaf17]KQM64199.1 cytochrome C biogenesis protein CcmA [Sphingomonas sp. Leaf17]
MTAGLAFDRVACLRGGRMLFEELSFALQPGDAALVTGPNGVGKSSLVRIAAGLLAPTQGRVTRCGGIALLGEAHALDPERRLGDALGFWAGLDGGAAVLEPLGLADLAAVPVRLLSTGQRRRAGLARVLGSGAGVWLLDEPANGLDSDAVAMLEALVSDHRAGGGIALVATHTSVALPGAVRVALA